MVTEREVGIEIKVDLFYFLFCSSEVSLYMRPSSTMWNLVRFVLFSASVVSQHLVSLEISAKYSGFEVLLNFTWMHI